MNPQRGGGLLFITLCSSQSCSMWCCSLLCNVNKRHSILWLCYVLHVRGKHRVILDCKAFLLMLLSTEQAAFGLTAAFTRRTRRGLSYRVRYQGQRHLTVPAVLKHTHTHTEMVASEDREKTALCPWALVLAPPIHQQPAVPTGLLTSY